MICQTKQAPIFTSISNLFLA
uniref:Uncharacterized protein n=1 Tax=Rhizophora mucronata TaxID=61149 RepID=A0A2P2QIY4_RHIMU